MTETFDDMPDLHGTRKTYVKRMDEYAYSAEKVALAYERFGVRRVSGEPGEDLRRNAVKLMLQIRDVLGTDRLPISDRLAVVPNYYGSYKPPGDDDEEEIVESKTEPNIRTGNPDAFRSGTMTYVVAMELVIRDFRNYEALYEPLVNGGLRHLRHPCNSPLPPVVPNEKARVFDIPVGYISYFNFDHVSRIARMSASGQNGEYIHIRLEMPPKPLHYDKKGTPYIPEKMAPPPKFIDDIGGNED